MHLTELPANFTQLAELASQYLDEITGDFYQRHNIKDDKFDLRVLKFKRAVMRQVDYMSSHGVTSSGELADRPKSVSQSVGRTTINKTFSTADVGNTSTGAIISPDAIRALAGTGLLYRGVRYL